ncbi:MAG TPA: DNA cytosine methyltransferase [Propionibacteriaceae bacterium]|nr:DNA cytosine methyltransferase [Propionibacteriaceae bacterium]
MIVDLFAGPGGWSEGLRSLGLADVGVELDAAACATRAAAGHPTIRADVASYPPERFAGAEGLIASPPCQDFSVAGGGAGRAGRTGHLIDTVPAWVATVRPRWVACEQVPPCLPIWREHAATYRRLGYSTWCGVLNAADFGVPQTRRRAILLARLDGPALPPPPTHARGGGDTLFGALRPWVSMAEALGWEGEDQPARTLCGDRSPRWLYPDRDGTHGRMVGFPRRDDRGGGADDYRRRDLHAQDGPSGTVTARWRSAVVLNPGSLQAHRQRPSAPRTLDQPAPTMAFGHDSASWAWEAPATTVAGDPPITARCHHDEGSQGADAKSTDQVRAGDYEGTEPIRLTLAEALVLQGFRPDYPVQGTKTKAFEQVGNAVPPLLAAHVLAAVTGRQVAEVAA